MAITQISSSQINSIVNEVYNNMTGKNDTLSTIDCYNGAFGDIGTNDISALRDSWTGKLLVAIAKRWFTDESYRSGYNDIYFVDARQFGAITEMVTVVAPDVSVNSAYNVKNGDTIGTYTLNVPKTTTKYFSNIEAWAIPFTIKGERIETAFKNAEELENFVAYCWLVIDNKIVEHLTNMNELNRNQYIAEKIYYASHSDTIKGIHLVDLVNEYYNEVGALENKTANDFLHDDNALRWAIKKLTFYRDLMKKQTSKFNYDVDEDTAYVRATPDDRIVIEMLGIFNDALDSNALSNTYHTEFIEKPNFVKATAWCGLGDLSFKDLSTINVTTKTNHGVNTDGVVCLMVDKFAIVHTIVRDRIGHHRLDIEDVDIFEHQFVDQYFTNMTLNGIVFKLGTYTV